MFIDKGDGAYCDLMFEVDAMFNLTPLQRSQVERAAATATSKKELDQTWEDFYKLAGLEDAELSSQPMVTSNYTDGDGNPDGGHAEACGLAIRWQRGKIEPDEMPPWNGCFTVTVLQAVKAQLEFYQRTKYKSAENAIALEHVDIAITVLERRQRERFCRGVRGKHSK